MVTTSIELNYTPSLIYRLKEYEPGTVVNEGAIVSVFPDKEMKVIPDDTIDNYVSGFPSGSDIAGVYVLVNPIRHD